MSKSTIPVLLMNPEQTHMARRKSTHHRKPATHRRRRHHNPANPTRHHRRHHIAPLRRRRRHHRNPSLDLKGLALAGLGGVGIGAAEFALDGMPSISNGMQAAILAGIGIVGGAVASMFSPPLGFGLLAAGVGVGAYKGGTMLLASPKAAAAPKALEGTRAELAAVRAELGAVRAELGLPPGRMHSPHTTAAHLRAVTANLP